MGGRQQRQVRPGQRDRADEGARRSAYTSGYDYNNPTQTTTTGRWIPNLSADTADEILVSFDKQIGDDFAVSASYIWRQATRTSAGDRRDNWSSANYVAGAVDAAGGGCPAGARLPGGHLLQPDQPDPDVELHLHEPAGLLARLPGLRAVRPQADVEALDDGTQLLVQRRAGDRGLGRRVPGLTDSTLNNTTASNTNYDPTNIETSINGGQYAPESTSSGLGNVFVNAKWIFRVTASTRCPWWQINVAAFYNSRSGYPFVRSVLSPSRPFGGGQAVVYLDRRGDVRLPTFQTVDLQVDKAFTLFNRIEAVVSMDIFNLLNGNTSLSIRGGQNASNANQISSILAPRVIRFGCRVTF